MSGLKDLVCFTAEERDRLLVPRPGETRLGQTVELPDTKAADLTSLLEQTKARRILLGIPEDIGPRANCGQGGANGAWEAMLPKLLNTQDNGFLHGEEFMILGHLKVDDLMEQADGLSGNSQEELATLRELVSRIDDRLIPVIRAIVASGKEAVLVGGGHNNCYGAIKGSCLGLRDQGTLAPREKLHVLNLDPHADLREMEGRHSGNGFTYAFEEGYMERYAITGLHRSYNPQSILERLEAHPGNFLASWFDDLLLLPERWSRYLEDAIAFAGDHPTGIELDLDAIAGLPVSAATPSGISVEQARTYIQKTGTAFPYLPYIHFAEGAPDLQEDGPETIGKTLGYLITDFLRTRRAY